MSFWYKGNMIPTGGGGGSGEVYSTEETRIGTWIDGKPIYRQIFQGTFADNVNAKKTIGTIPDIDYPVRCYGTFLTNDGVYCFLNAVGTGTDSHSFVDISEGTGAVGVKTRISVAFNSPVTITVEYTKTTDEAAVSEGEG